MSKPKILLLGEIIHARQSWMELASMAEIIKPGVNCREDFINKSNEGEFDGVLVIYRTFYSSKITGNLDEELIRSLPSSLKFICHSGAGYDQIDVAECSKRGISVSNVPSAIDSATADTALFLMIGALRGFNQSIISLRNGQWRGDPQPPLGRDPDGKILGILGCGGVGRNLARKAAALGMEVIYHNRRKSGAITEARYTILDDLLRTSDVISVCLPLNSSTRHTLSHFEFDMMKPGVVIVNTARGAVIDEEALVAALENGKVWSCGLDVYENEPDIHPGLLKHPRAILLPHLGTYTVETHTKMEERCIQNVRLALDSGKLLNIVPEQVYMNGLER